MTNVELEKRLRQGRAVLTDASLKSFGHGKFNSKRGSLVSDDGTWELYYDPKTKGVRIGDTIRSTRPETESFQGTSRQQSKKIPPYDGIEVKISDLSTTHKLVKIYENGRVYAAPYAEPFPTNDSVLRDYQDDPKAFLPYDESTGRYL